MSFTHRATIFDFDGVLVDSEPLHEWAIRKSIEPRGWTFDSEQFMCEIVGKGDENAYRVIAKWNQAQISEPELRAMLQSKWAWMDEGIAQEKYSVQLGAIEAIRMAKRMGPVAVCSSSVKKTVLHMLERIGALSLLNTVVCGDDVPRLKPAPDGYLLAASRLSIDPVSCLAVEDTPTGVLAAKAAGMRVVAVEHTVPGTMLNEANDIFARIGDIPFPVALGA